MRTRGYRAHRTPGIPCALNSERAGINEYLAKKPFGEIAKVCPNVIARSAWRARKFRRVGKGARWRRAHHRSTRRMVGTLPPSLIELRRPLCPPYEPATGQILRTRQ